jgi:hypothetical protein
MTSIACPASAEASAAISPIGQSANRDDLEIARRRMKHLAPWHVEPMPMPLRPATAPGASPVSGAAKARHERVALQVLALQMGYARPTSALS